MAQAVTAAAAPVGDTNSQATPATAVRHVIIGTAGHVDHGKTTLVKALTGIDPDRLAEEKARGMTIDLGFAHLDLPGDPPIAAGIVDVPGHERFLKNMLSGTGGIDLALLVVAADAGPMPQTREHLDVLTLLDIRHAVVALTCCDRVDDELREIAAMTVRETLAGTPLANAPIVPVSAVTGVGIADLSAALGAAARACPPRDSAAPFRLPVDRVFSLAGVGTVATGTLVAGKLPVGAAVEIQPQGLHSRARTLQTHSHRVDSATPGTRVAVSLPGVEVGQIERGAVIAAPGALAGTRLIDVHLSLLPGAAGPIRHRERVRLHLGTGEALARVHLLSGSAADPGAVEVAAQLLVETSIAPARGERFVVRTYSPARVVGGGLVIDPTPPRRYRRRADSADTLARFAARANAAKDQSGAVYAVLTSRHEERTVEEVARELGIDRTIAEAALEALAESGRVGRIGDRFLSDVAVKRLEDTARRAAATYHRQNPLRRALPRDVLRAPLARAATVRDYAALVAFLVERGVVLTEGAAGLRLPDHVVTVPAAWRAPMAEILGVYESAGFQPPSPDNFQANYPRDINVRSILQILVENGDLIHLTDDLYLHATSVAQVVALLPRLAAQPEGIGVGTLRDATKSSRKIILPLLEYLDTQRITIRVGDKRLLPQ